MIIHILKDGKVLESIEGHVVTEETIYRVIENMEKEKK